MTRGPLMVAPGTRSHALAGEGGPAQRGRLMGECDGVHARQSLAPADAGGA